MFHSYYYFSSGVNFFQIPEDIWLAEAVGVAVNAEGNIFILNRGNHPLLEFTPDGEFVRSLGEGSPIFHAAHSVRFDDDDNMWVVDSANNLVVRVSPNGIIEQTLGRRLEPWVSLTHGAPYRAIPALTNFYHPTDTAVAPDGSAASVSRTACCTRPLSINPRPSNPASGGNSEYTANRPPSQISPPDSANVKNVAMSRVS